MRRAAWLALAACAAACASNGDPTPQAPPPPPEPEAAFTYFPPGALEPGSGLGSADPTVYAPDIVFPIKDAPSYLNSQVHRPGGQAFGGGDQCEPVNFSDPWRDNFCEDRPGSNRRTLNCPSNAAHQGQDIRAGGPELCRRMRATSPPERTQIPVVAVKDGFISYVGSFTVNLRADGEVYRYMHLNMERLQVEAGQAVQSGDVIGYLSNDFGGSPTTFHLHLEFRHNIDGVGWTWVSPYMSLVRAYERQYGPGAMLPAPSAGG